MRRLVAKFAVWLLSVACRGEVILTISADEGGGGVTVDMIAAMNDLLDNAEEI
jgi:hypothetical protein